MKLNLFLILTLGCAAAALSCSKEQIREEMNPQTSIAETAPASLDGIWQKTCLIGTECQTPSSEKTSVVAVIDGSVAKLSISSENGLSSAEGTALYDSSEGTGRLEFARSDGALACNVSNVEIIRAFDGGRLGVERNQRGTDDAAFGESGGLLVTVVSMTDGVRDTCLFQQISALPVQTKASVSQLFGPNCGVKELVCNDGKTVKTDSWMSNLPDETVLRSLAIPGTHDAATSSISLAVLGKDQIYDLKEQLDMGVRYFDLRIDDAGRITHGGIRTKYTFRGAMNEMVRWMDAHSTEGILAEIRWEKDLVAYTAYETAVKAQISAAKAYNSSIGRLFPKRKKSVPDLETELGEWVEKSKAAYYKEASSVLEVYEGRTVLIDNDLTLGRLRGKISFYDCDNSALVDVSGHTEKGDYPDSKSMSSDEALQKRIAGVLNSMDELTASDPDDESFGKVCSAGYMEPWATKGQIPFAVEMAPQVIAKSDELVKAGKTIHAIVMMDYAPLQLNGMGSSFLDNIIMMNFPAE